MVLGLHAGFVLTNLQSLSLTTLAQKLTTILFVFLSLLHSISQARLDIADERLRRVAGGGSGRGRGSDGGGGSTSSDSWVVVDVDDAVSKNAHTAQPSPLCSHTLQ